jgi:glutamine synthetase
MVTFSSMSAKILSVAARAEEYLRTTGIADQAAMAPEYEFYVFDTVRHSCDINHAFYNIDSVEGAWNTGSDRDQTDLPVLGMPIHGGYRALPPNDRLYNLRAEMTALIEGVVPAEQVAQIVEVVDAPVAHFARAPVPLPVPVIVELLAHDG